MTVEAKPKKFDCPGCDEEHSTWAAALSRFDNQTKVCRKCGEYEAWIQIDAHFSGYDVGAALTGFGLNNKFPGQR